MKKFLTRVLTLCTLCFAMSVQNVFGKVSLTEETLDVDGYRVLHHYDFHEMTADGNPIGEIKVEYCGIKIDNKELHQFLTPGITNWYAWYSATSNISIRFREGYGLYNWGSGDRGCAIGKLKAGNIVAFEINGSRLVIYKGNNDNAVDVTDSIHNLQASNGLTPDKYKYFQMKEDGRLDMLLGKKCGIAAAAILIDADAPETVDAPLADLEAVYYSERQIAITPGMSSYGNEVETYYSLDGSNPIYGDSIWTPSAENPDSMVFSGFKVEPIVLEDGTKVFGDYIYDNSGSITIGEADLAPEDTTGIITMKLVSVTKEGVVSEMTVKNFNVREITLNSPRFVLVGIDDIYRDYRLEWDNNTLCSEEFSITVETENETFDGVKVGDVYRIYDCIKAVVKVEGYQDGICELNDLVEEGNVYYRKYDNSIHDWDFLNLTKEQIEGIKGETIDYGYMIDENGDTIIISRDDVINNPPVEDFTIVYKNMGWGGFDAKNSRCLRRTVKETIVNPIYGEDGTTVIGHDTIVQTKYAEELTGLFHDGLEFGGTAGMMIYLPEGVQETSGLGLYLMGPTTVKVPNVKYGEFVLFKLGKGGTNYITNKYSSCEFVNTEEGVHTKFLDKEFIQSIDIYTADELPSGIVEIPEGGKLESVYVNVYSIDGRLVKSKVHTASALNGLDKGIYIVGGKKYIVR